MTNVNAQKTYREGLRDQLLALSENPEVAAAEGLRIKVLNALEDINEVSGKENALMVIQEIKDALDNTMENTGVRSIRPSERPSDAPENAVA